MNSLLQKLSTREKVLFAATLMLVGGCAVYFAVQRALLRIDLLDKQIIAAEGNLVSMRQLEARGKSIDDAYSEVASHHSSAWTEQEIHDRLRLEIYRLAMQNPPPEDRPEMVRVAGSEFAKLVNIPSLRQGVLQESDRGDYREYQIRIVIPDPTPIRNLVEFLRRLQESNHSLRIDTVEMVRPPDGTEFFNTRIDVTRTVVNSVPGDIVSETALADASLLRNSGFEVWYEETGLPDAWQIEGMEVKPVIEPLTEGQLAFSGEAVESNAQLYQQVDLVAGRTYEVAADIALTGAGKLAAATDGGEELPGAQRIEGNGASYRYSARVVPPGAPGETIAVRVPLIALDGPGSSVFIDNVVLREGV